MDAPASQLNMNLHRKWILLLLKAQSKLPLITGEFISVTGTHDQAAYHGVYFAYFQIHRQITSLCVDYLRIKM